MNLQSINDSVASLIATNPWIILIVIWSIVWKLIALWKAAKNNHLTVFIVLAVLNTVGVAEIAYLAYLYIKSKKEIKTEESK